MCEPQATDLGDLAADVASAFNIQALNDLGDGIGAFCVQDLLELLGDGTAQQVLLHTGRTFAPRTPQASAKLVAAFCERPVFLAMRLTR